MAKLTISNINILIIKTFIAVIFFFYFTFSSLDVDDGQRAVARGGDRVRGEVERANDRIRHRLRTRAFKLYPAGRQEIPHQWKVEHLDRLSKVNFSKRFSKQNSRLCILSKSEVFSTY